ncbi:glycerophosphoryl diester phosphodiesterase [Segniliparus rotundus DSM 44985]|uniref:Glycerophosphoryl diester phosphodiesterase n=1 Tax=Segniliparus rotundus (strain ATCC BAA-972 / CDC 1076 / CIP 108378 / DSM 44985 / JCM 13578) TaxID=640132 RepID=D6ZDY4_SEGRD|nr:glycerophosphodiester phosphodiesterase family protein [Segniliparus rotundus]ADG99391.1 glycerophosphoryl diester phosphodiesterase [Segniliparus rotundus DSM 44985]
MPEVVAHRGASGELPEHTLAAYERALEQGADGLECDIRLTADGVLVCVHDRTTARTGSGNLVVSTSGFEQLDQLDYGSWHPSGQPAKLVTLDALIELAVSHTSRPVTVFIETKHPVRQGGGLERALAQTLARFDLLKSSPPNRTRVVMMSFSALAVRRMRRLAPNVPRAHLAESTLQLLGPSADFAEGDILGPSVRLLRNAPELVARAAGRGKAVYCWTADQPEDVLLCRELGVRWVATNWPRRAKELLAGPP